MHGGCSEDPGSSHAAPTLQGQQLLPRHAGEVSPSQASGRGSAGHHSYGGVCKVPEATLGQVERLFHVPGYLTPH